MKIAFIVPSLEARGPVIFTENLVKGLSFHPFIEIEVFYLKNRKGITFPVMSHLLRPQNLHRLFAFDIVHSTMFLPDLLLALFPIKKYKKVSSLHNFLDQDLGLLYRPMVARCVSVLWYLALRHFQNLIYSSQHMALSYRKELSPLNEVVIDYGIPAPAMEEIDIQDEPLFDMLKSSHLKIIGTVCMVIKRKGLDQLIRVLASLQDCAVVVVGEGPESQYLNYLAEEHGVKDRFHIIGFRKQSARYNKKFNVFAMVSWSEGFGLAMLEAMGSGIPVVCSRLPIYTESLRDSDLSFFEVGNQGDLIRALQSVFSNPDYWSEAALRLYHARFNLLKMIDRHIAYYNDCLNSKQ